MSELILFLSFSILAIVSSALVITVKNPVHSVLFLILSFIASAGLLFLLEIEFISLIFIVVYVGAIAVLFLFVVMMLDIKITESDKNYLKYFPVGSFLGLAFLGEILFIVFDSFESNPQRFIMYSDWSDVVYSITNVQVLGQVLYTTYFLYFLIAGLILLVAMLGAIVLTLTFDKKARTQTIYRQVSRNFNNAIFLTSA
jgi:NADH-quinone oxidoreductase subunit J